jgi:hypothetical protein
LVLAQQTQPSNLDLIISESLCFDIVVKDAVCFWPSDLNSTTLSIFGVSMKDAFRKLECATWAIYMRTFVSFISIFKLLFTYFRRSSLAGYFPSGLHPWLCHWASVLLAYNLEAFIAEWSSTILSVQGMWCNCRYNPLKSAAFLAKRVWNCAFLTHECTSRFLITKRHEEDDLVSKDSSRVRVMKTTGWCRNSCLIASHTQAGVAWIDWCRHWTESVVKWCPNNGAIHVTRYVWISGLYSVASWRRLYTSNRILAKFSPTHRARRVGCWENWRTGKESTSPSVRALFVLPCTEGTIIEHWRKRQIVRLATFHQLVVLNHRWCLNPGVKSMDVTSGVVFHREVFE